MSIEHVNSESFKEAVLSADLPVLVDFYADWCAPCKVLAPVLDTLVGESAGNYKIVKLNIEDSGDVAAEYGIRGIPTMIIFKQGKEVERLVGLKTKNEIEGTLKQV